MYYYRIYSLIRVEKKSIDKETLLENIKKIKINNNIDSVKFIHKAYELLKNENLEKKALKEIIEEIEKTEKNVNFAILQIELDDILKIENKYINKQTSENVSTYEYINKTAIYIKTPKTSLELEEFIKENEIISIWINNKKQNIIINKDFINNNSGDKKILIYIKNPIKNENLYKKIF